MTQIPGTNVIAPVVPLDTADTHPTHEAAYGRGGYRVVASNAVRDAIPTPRREEGMLVFVSATGLTWRLGSNLTTWTEVTSGGITDAPSDSIIYGRRNETWTDIAGPANLQVNRGTSSEVAAYTALSGEPVWDTQQKRLFVGDGTTSGGIPVGYPVVTGVIPSEGVAITSSTFVTPMTVTLSPLNSVWHVKGCYALTGVDEPTASVLFEIHNASILTGLFSTRRSGDSTVTTYGTDSYRPANTPRTLTQLTDGSDFTVLSFDCIVQAYSSPLAFGFRFKSSSNGDHAAYVGYPSTDRMYARRLA